MGDRPAIAAPPADSRSWFPVRREGRPAAVAILAAAAYSFWPTLAKLYGEWLNDPQCSHGFLVPLFSLALLWTRRDRFPAQVLPAPQIGFAVLVIAIAARIVGGIIYFDWLDAFSLLPFLAALFLI